MGRFAHIRAGRGYTLLEMSITMVVVGLLLGGILMPLGERLRTEQYEQVRSDLVAIKEALVAYAASSSAPGFNWVHWNRPGGMVYSEGRLPAGRRFLPCPDLDGDGIEDRIGRVGDSTTLSTRNNARTGAFFSHLGDFGPGSTTINENEIETAPLTLTIGGVVSTISLIVRNPVTAVQIGSTNPVRGGAGTGRSQRELLAFEDDAPPAQLNLGGNRSYGHCASDSGAVPWATLGTPPVDPWGNRYIYRVDPYFAHSLLGFGPESRADVFDPTRALLDPTTNIIRNNLYGYISSQDQVEDVTINNLYEYRKRNEGGETYSFAYGGGNIVSSKLPGLICLGSLSTTCDWSAVAMTVVGMGTSYLGEVADEDRAMVVWDTFGGIQAQREYDEGDPIDGMVFVVLSTGQNRAGGIPWTNPYDSMPSGDGFINCLGTSAASASELVNIPSHACNSPAPASNAGEDSYTFNQQPRQFGFGPDLDFDDELAYMSGRELLGRLAGDGVDLGPIWIPPGKRI